MTMRGPRWSIARPTAGVTKADTRSRNENAPAVTPRPQPNSSSIAGNSSE